MWEWRSGFLCPGNTCTGRGKAHKAGDQEQRQDCCKIRGKPFALGKVSPGHLLLHLVHPLTVHGPLRKLQR